jgi:hypothetical protein
MGLHGFQGRGSRRLTNRSSQPLPCTFTKSARAKIPTAVDLISNALPFGHQWYDTLENTIGYATHGSRSHHAVIRVYDDAGNVIETHEHKDDFKESLSGVKIDWISAQPRTVGGCLINCRERRIFKRRGNP